MWYKITDRLKDSYLLCLLLAILALILPAPFMLGLVILFPSLLLINISGRSFLVSMPLMFLINLAFFIMSAIVLELIGAPVTSLSLILFNLITSTLIIGAVKLSWFKPFNADANFDKTLGVIYVLFLLALVVRLGSTLGIEAPILHDPVAHAAWAKKILTEQGIHYFYSPGLHIISAFFAKSTNLSVALATHFTTNFFNAFSVLSWGVVAYLTTKNRLFSIFTAIAMFVAAYPTLLYLTAGKNAFVAAVAFIPLVFLFLHRFALSRNYTDAGLLAISLLALFFIHYPTFGYLAIFSGITLGLLVIKKLFVKEQIAAYLIGLVIVAAITAGFGGVWLIMQKNDYANKVSSSNNSEIYDVDIEVSLKELVFDLKATYSEFKATTDSFSTFFLPITLISLLLLLFLNFDRNGKSILIFAITVGLVPYAVNILDIASLNTTRSTGILLFFQVFALSVAYAASLIITKFKPSRWIMLALGSTLCLFVGYVAMVQYTKFRTNSINLSVVDNYDLKAYAWINDKLQTTDKIVINAQINPQRPNVIYPTDGGMWIPIYTDNSVSTSFLEFSSTESHRNYKLYKDLATDSRGVKYIDELKAVGFCYYYHDEGVFGKPLNPRDLVKKSPLKKVYSNQKVAIYSWCK